MIASRATETTTTTGTGTVNLGGAKTGQKTLALANGTGKQCYYVIQGTSEWEEGIGTVTAGSPDTLSRDTVLRSSNSDALVSFSSGTKDVFITIPGFALDPMVLEHWPIIPPTSPSAFDDEFITPTLNAKWTVDLNATASGVVLSPSFQGSWLRFDSPGAASDNSYRLIQPLSGFSAGTAFDVVTRVAFSNNNGSYGNLGIAISNNATLGSGSFVQYYVTGNGDNNKIARWNGAAASTGGSGRGARATWLKMQRNTSNVTKLWYSDDGHAWKQFEDLTLNWNITELFLFGDGSTSGSGNPHAFRWDFVRVNDARFNLPNP